ncbi:MAG: response regulator [Chloroflexaceae bacterium]|nr:response regulator [Chloroflexaceae bacterium]
MVTSAITMAEPATQPAIQPTVAPLALRPLPEPPAVARLLVSDDDPGIERAYTFLLPHYGFEVMTVPHGDGSRTLELCHSYCPDLLISDVNKPGLNGHEIAACLHNDQTTAHLPVLLATAMDEGLERRRGYSASRVDYMVKPFGFEQLLYRVVTQLGLSRESQEQMVAFSASLPGAPYRHPVTGIAGPQVLANALEHLTASPCWAAYTFSLANFHMVLAGLGRTAADEVLLRLSLAIRAALGPAARDVALIHPSFDARIAVVGPAPLLHGLHQRVAARFLRDAERLTASALGQPLPQLTMRFVDATAGPMHTLRQFWQAIESAERLPI